MYKEDIPKTTLIVYCVIYAYKKMSFRLINVRVTYQRMMNKVFHRQIGRNMEVYVDDMIIKSAAIWDHLADLEECLQTIRDYNIRLNPNMCTFGVGSGKFIGHLVGKRGIEANAKNIKAILDMRSP